MQHEHVLTHFWRNCISEFFRQVFFSNDIDWDSNDPSKPRAMCSLTVKNSLQTLSLMQEAFHYLVHNEIYLSVSVRSKQKTKQRRGMFSFQGHLLVPQWFDKTLASFTWYGCLKDRKYYTIICILFKSLWLSIYSVWHKKWPVQWLRKCVCKCKMQFLRCWLCFLRNLTTNVFIIIWKCDCVLKG